MVLSDGRSRERYDRQVEQTAAQNRMRQQLMEEERQWAIDEQDQGTMGRNDNKFQKDPMYKRKVEVQDMDGRNKFGRGRGGNGNGMSSGPQQSFGARPLEIDEEAEMAQQQMMQNERESLMREKQQAEAQLAQEQARERKQMMDEERKREERRRVSSERGAIQDEPSSNSNKRPEPWSPQGAQQQGSGQQMQEGMNPQGPPGGMNQQPQMGWQSGGGQANASSPQQGQPDMNAMMEDMKQRLGQKKIDEAARVKDQLEGLQGGSGQATPGGSTSFGGGPQQQQQKARRTGGGGRSGSMLFPGKGGVVVEDSDYIARDILIDEYLGRESSAEPKFISYVPPDEGTSGSDATQNIQAAMSTASMGNAAPQAGGPQRAQESRPGVRPGGGATPMGGDGFSQRGGRGPPPQVGPSPQQRSGPGGRGPAMSGEQEREQERLRDMKAKLMGKQPPGTPAGPGFGQQTGPTKTSSTTREQERLQGMKIGRGRGPSPAERTTLQGENQPVAKTSADIREQQRLQQMGARGGIGATLGGMGGSQQQKQPAQQEGQSAVEVQANIEKLKEAHRTEMTQLKNNMEEVASKTLEDEIVKIAKIHAAEITRLKSEYEATRAEWAQATGGQKDGEAENAAMRQMEQLKMEHAAELERMREGISIELEEEYEERIFEMEEAHRAELEQILAENGNGEATMRLQAEMEDMKQAHMVELDEMTVNYDQEMGALRNELDARTAEMYKAHQREIQQLTQTQKTASTADTTKIQEEAVANLTAKHKEEMEKLVAQHEQQLEKLRTELGAKSEHLLQAQVDDVKNSMAAEHKADKDKMASQHKQEMGQLVKTELDKLQQQHDREMEKMLSERGLIKQRAENVKRELQRAAQGQGGPAATMTPNQRIDLVLKSFEGVYDPGLIEQLRVDFKARETELNQLITNSNNQISTLQSRLDSTNASEDKLKMEINTMTQWKQSAEAELQRVQQGTLDKGKEITELNNSIQSMNKEILDLKGQLDRLTKERDTSKQEIYELREWKKNAEVERGRLEKELKAKDGVIAKLQYEFNERDEDVNFLVPEVRALMR